MRNRIMRATHIFCERCSVVSTIRTIIAVFYGKGENVKLKLVERAVRIVRSFSILFFFFKFATPPRRDEIRFGRRRFIFNFFTSSVRTSIAKTLALPAFLTTAPSSSDSPLSKAHNRPFASKYTSITLFTRFHAFDCAPGRCDS